jgi:hypothetical protein
LQEKSFEDQGSGCHWIRLKKGLILLLFLFLFFYSLSSYAGSIREVSQNITKVKSLEPSYRFAVLGDSRDGDKTYQRLIRHILQRRPDFIIHVGDMISQPGEKEWKNFFEISKEIDISFFPVVGNHEVAGTSRGEEIFRKQFQLPERKTYYSFQAGEGLFVVLNSERGKGRIIDDQWTWLKSVLSSSKERFKMVFLHRPLFPPTDSLKWGRGMDRYPEERDNLHRLFLDTGVKTVFSGDDHRYDRREVSRILYLITGGGGSPIYAFEENGGYFHYVWMKVLKEKMEGEVIDLQGNLRDRFVIE